MTGWRNWAGGEYKLNLLEYWWPGEGESKTTIFRGYRRKRKQEKQEERRRSSWVEEVVLVGEGEVRKL